MRENVVVEKLSSAVAANGIFSFDFKKDAFGRLSVELEADRSGSVTVAFSECQKDGLVDPAPGGFRRSYSDSYEIVPGKNIINCNIPAHKNPYGNQEKCMKPPAGGEIAPFRYVDVAGDVSNVCCIRTAFFGGFDDSAAEFVSSDARLNKVWEFCKYSIKATNAFDCYIDGDRERLPYEADAYINQLCHFCCDNDYSKARRTIDTLFKNPTWPIEWRLIMPAVVEDYILYSGDKASLERWRNALDNSLLGQHTFSDGLLPATIGEENSPDALRTIIDWPKWERDDYEFAEKLLVPNCYLVLANMAMYRMYGDEKYLAAANQVKNTLRTTMMKNGVFTDNPETDHTAVHSAIFPAAMGVAEKGEYPALARIIRERGMACSVYGAQFLLDACFIVGDADFAIELMRSDKERSWLNMLKSGATITMEAWSNQVKPNQDWNHPWGAAPGNVIPRRLCGIRPLKPGFEEFIVEPQPGDLKSFTYRQPTPHGAITIEYCAGEAVKVTHPSGKTESFSDPAKIFTIDR